MRIAALALLGCTAACNGHTGGGGALDAAAPDAPRDAGPCGADWLVDGELVDLDSTTAQLRGVSNAKLTLEGTPARTSTTAPNGRFELCAPRAAAWTFDVDAPGDYLDGKAYIEAEAPRGSRLSLRTFSQLQASALYAFDPARAHVLVLLVGDRGDLSLDRPHAPPLAASDDDNDGVYTWEAGGSGRYVLFPNVDASSPTATLGGDYAGPHIIPLVAGKLTLAAIFFVFL